MKFLMLLPVLILIAASASCFDTADYRPDDSDPVQPVVNFSGDWEKNYQSSDDFEIEFKNYVMNIQHQLQEMQENRRRDPSFNMDNGIMLSRESIIGLAKFTEQITRMPLLHIVQDKSSIKIKRKNDFPLYCEFFDKRFSSNKTPYGTETCTWNRGQLFIRINLKNGLNIAYQITLAPDARKLNIITTVASKEATFPMTISNYYDRYTEPENNYSCIHTLTRNDVCDKGKLFEKGK